MDFRILGPLEVDHEGRPLSLGGAKQRALLAVLLIHANQVVSMDKLMDDLWGEDRPETAVNTVQVYVSQLRKVLGAGRRREDPALIAREPGYLLKVEPNQLDVMRFQRLCEQGRAALSAGDVAVASVRLRDALSLWRGQPLSDFTLERFARAEIERLDEMRLAALEDCLGADLELGRHAELVGELESLVKDHPLRERLRGHLMLALYRAERQAEALQVYQETTRILGDALGSDPSPALQGLHTAILQRDHSLEAPAAAAPLPLPEPRLAVPPAVEERPSPAHPPARGAAEGEMRTLTALFADIVGSTSLAERLSPDEVRAIIGECVSRLSHVVEEFGGMVQAYLGDGIAAYFGLPVAHEDDADRAALAALRILHSVGEYSREVESAWGISDFNVRVGVNSGRTAIGTVGAAVPQEVAFGDPLNVAARLESFAEPGTIAIGDAVVRRLASGFVIEPLGEVTVKGRSGAVNAWRLVGRETGGRIPPATPLVGRESEMARLDAAMAELEAGRGQVLLLAGEAGVGKTRLLAEARARAPDRVTWLEGRCLSYGGELPYWPFVEILRGWIGVGEADPEVAVRAKLRAKLEALVGRTSEDLIPHLGRLLSLRLEPGPEARLGTPPPEEVAAGIGRAYRVWLEAVCERDPAILVLDDVQGVDRPTRELAEELLTLVDSQPLMVALATRPGAATEGWQLWLRVLQQYRHRVIEIGLAALGDEDAGRLADALSPTGSLESDTRAEILARSEGNPLYLEELLRALVETGGLERRGWTLSVTAAGLLLPPALESLLVARIQELPEDARRAAQAAATIGREFSLSILERVADVDNVQVCIAELLRSEMIRELRRYPQLEFTFHHPLMQEAALSTLSPARMKALYRRVAEAFEGEFGEAIEERLEPLAFYFYRSDAPEKALTYLERAGERAASMHAHEQAMELWSRAARLAERLGDGAAKARIEALAEDLRETTAG